MEKEINLRQLLISFWKARIYIIITTALCLLAAIAFLTLVTPVYKSTMIVAPADGYALGDYASAVEHDQIAALPFWRPKDREGASTDFYRFMHTLRGPMAASILLKDTAVVDGVNRHSKNKITTPEEFSIYLNRKVSIDPLGATPLRRMSYNHPDAEFAAEMLRKMHLVADQMIRRDRRKQSQSRIEYLENALNKTLNPDHRKGITNLLMQQEHIQMLANLDEAYAAIVVEPASSSPRPTWPNKTLMLAVAVFLGLFLGYMAWCLRHDEEV